MDPAQSAATALQAVNVAVNSQTYEQQLNHAVYYQQQQQQQHQQQQQLQQQQQQNLQQQDQQMQLAQSHPMLNVEVPQEESQNNSFNRQKMIDGYMQGIVVPRGFQAISPPQSEFGSRQELIDYIHRYAKANGFGIVISHSNDKAIYFTCELGGSYRNKRNISDERRKRRLNTRKINCPFAMVANSKRDDNSSNRSWNLRVSNGEHNHDKMNITESFPSLRRRKPEINAMIRELYNQGEKPSIIENKLKLKFQGILINREDIYNETRKMKREERQKREGSLPSIQNLTDSIPNSHPGVNTSSQATSVTSQPSSMVSVDPIIHSQHLHQIQSIPTHDQHTYDAENLPSILQAQLNQMYGAQREDHQQLSQLSELAVENYVQAQAKADMLKRVSEQDAVDENIDTSLGK